MDTTTILRFEPTMDLLVEALESLGWECQRSTPFPDRQYRGILPFAGQSRLEPGMLYLVPPEQESLFPMEGYACVSSRRIRGHDNRLWCPGRPWEELLRHLLDWFAQLQEQQSQLDQLIFSGGNLEDLCRLGQSLSGLPLCIHDDWFILIAMSDAAQGIMPPERLGAGGKPLVPRQVLEEFKFDTDYDHTYAQQGCQLWHNASGTGQCLYVNLWEDSRYLGRLLMLGSDAPFRRRDYLLAEVLAQRAGFLLRQPKHPDRRPYRNLDDLMELFLEGERWEPGELRFLLDTLAWKEDDPLLCIRLQSQQEEISEVLGHVLHSDLFRFFPNSYIMYLGRQQCLVVNLARSKFQPTELHYRLSPLCRDYCLYAGVSAPVAGIRALHQAARQADIALEQAFFQKNQEWILFFSDCALDYMLKSLGGDLEPRYLAAAEWFTLLAYDEARGTRYFDTLKTFLLLERDIPKTAQALIIHRTTLLYRIQKILDLTGLDLENPDQRLYLLLSLRLLEQRRLIQSSEKSGSFS